MMDYSRSRVVASEHRLTDSRPVGRAGAIAGSVVCAAVIFLRCISNAGLVAERQPLTKYNANELGQGGPRP